MALRTPAAFIGEIIVTLGLNDKTYWLEAAANLDATLTPGTYMPLALAQHIASIMTTESGISGSTNTYSASFDVATAKVTLTRSGGAATWNPKITTAETDNILTGGVVDTAGDALLVGQYGPGHLGWIIASSSPTGSLSYAADQACAHSWIPSLPPAGDGEEQYERTVAEAIAMDGSGDVYVFNDWIVDDAEFPLYGGDFQRRTLRFERQTQADTAWYLSQFWGPLGGGKFRFYPDKDVATYFTCRFTADALRKGSRGVRLSGYALWTVTLEIRRAPA